MKSEYLNAETIMKGKTALYQFFRQDILYPFCIFVFLNSCKFSSKRERSSFVHSVRLWKKFTYADLNS